MGGDTKEKLIAVTLDIMRTTDPNHISMRHVAEATGIQPSVIYHYFPNKEVLLKHAFLHAQAAIRKALQELPHEQELPKLLRQRLTYHFDNAHLIVPMLRYFMVFKQEHPDEPGGHIPEQAYYHIKQVIDRGVEEGVYFTPDSGSDARVIVHALNGFVLEHYPMSAARIRQLIGVVQPFIERALTNRKEGGIEVRGNG